MTASDISSTMWYLHIRIHWSATLFDFKKYLDGESSINVEKGLAQQTRVDNVVDDVIDDHIFDQKFCKEKSEFFHRHLVGRDALDIPGEDLGRVILD